MSAKIGDSIAARLDGNFTLYEKHRLLLTAVLAISRARSRLKATESRYTNHGGETPPDRRSHSPFKDKVKRF